MYRISFRSGVSFLVWIKNSCIRIKIAEEFVFSVARRLNLDEISCQTWLAKQIAMDGSSKSSSAFTPIARKTAPRLRIEGLPGYEKLTDAEKELCSEVRLVPEAFLDFSRILVSENAKQGYLRLAQARMLIKIDVNKTRKLYDFLVNQGQINKEKI